jgi:putative oligomerization/nucleic acid binding protein
MASAGTETEAAASPSLKRWVLMVVGLAGTVACLTILFLCMRSVMDIGGRCVSGNSGLALPECPTGVPGLMIGSIFLGLGLLFVYAVNAVRPNLTWLAWPALFLSLGWNFLQYGIDPPGPESGPVWGWLVCAVLFIVMGGGPLVLGFAAVRNGEFVRERVPGAKAAHARATAVARRVTRQPASVLDELERLSKLHQSGELDDEQYETAKDQLLREGGKTL